MQKQHSYNLRARASNPEHSMRKPEIGDRVSIFWESLGKEYEGNLIKFDNVNKTFLVDYDNIPDGYDDDQIWENLDYVPWRFLDKFVRRQLRRLGKSAKQHSRLRSNVNVVIADGGNVSRWFEPGELSAAHPEFCEVREEHRHRRKRNGKLKEICADVSRSSEEEEDEDEIIPESQSGEDTSEHCDKEEGEELTDMFGDYHHFKYSDFPNKAVERQGQPEVSKREKKRTYANFGVFGVDRAQRDPFAPATPAEESSNSNDHFNTSSITQDMIMLKRPRDWAERELSKFPRVRGERRQYGAFMQCHGNETFQWSETDENTNNSPSVEDQVRAITKSFGISGHNTL